MSRPRTRKVPVASEFTRPHNQVVKTAFLVLIAAAATLWSQTFPSPNTNQPTVIQKVDPEYTPEAKAAGVRGTVLLAITITTDGVADQITLIKGLSYGLDEKAVECMRKWRFKPDLRDGEPVPVKAQIEVNFRLP